MTDPICIRYRHHIISFHSNSSYCVHLYSYILLFTNISNIFEGTHQDLDSALWSSVRELNFTISHAVAKWDLTLILPFSTISLFCGECRGRSACTYIQSDLALHSTVCCN